MKRELNVRSIFRLIITFSCIELIGDFISVPNFPVVKTWIGKVNEIEIFYQGKQVAMMRNRKSFLQKVFLLMLGRVR